MKIQMSQETTDILERVGLLLLHSFNLARLADSHMSRGGSSSYPRSSFLQANQKGFHCLTFRNSSLLVRLEQFQHSGWWEGRTRWRRSASLSRISWSHSVAWLVGDWFLDCQSMRGWIGSWITACKCPGQEADVACFDFWFCVQGLRETWSVLRRIKYLCQYDFLLVSVHMLNLLISVYSNKQWICV